MRDSTIRSERRETAAWITLDRPEKLNAFTVDMYAAVRAAITAAVEDEAARVVVLTGAGRAFSAGADRSLLDGSLPPAERERATEEFAAMLDVLGAADKPVIAAVNGLAVGIGATLLLRCDLVLVAESARLRFPFTALGLVPEAGSSVLLPQRARWPDAAWALLSSDWIDAADAVAMGVAWRAVPDDDLVTEASRAVEAIAAHEPASVAATKRLLTAGRTDLVRAAMAREHAEMRALARRDGGRDAPP